MYCMDYNLKFVTVGDCAIGKTCFVLTASTELFPEDYIPSGTGHYGTTVMYIPPSLTVSIGVTDTDSREGYLNGMDNAQRRILYYPDTHVFLVCFSMVNRNSFENIKTKWIPEITKHCPNITIILVGCKYDLVPYSEPENVVTQEMIDQMVKTTVASASIVTSSKSGYNIDKVFPLAIDEFNNNSKSEKIGYKKHTMPPKLSPIGKTPCIYVEKSDFGKGFEKLLDSDFYYDTKFVIYNSNKDVDVEIKAHSLVLACAPSRVIAKLFDEVLLCKDSETNSYSHELFEKLRDDINGGKVMSGFSSVSIDENESHVLKFRISNEISHRAFRSLLEIQYCGQSSTIKKNCQEEEFLNEVKDAATTFKCKYTHDIVDNYQTGEMHIFNESIETHLNNFKGREIKKKYFNKEFHSDVEIIFSQTDSSKNFHGHKLFLSLNCDVFRTMFEGNFVEHSSNQVDFSGEIGENVNRISEFNTLFEYIYSGHSTTINEINAVGLLSLAKEYGLPGLTSMCEVFISQSIEKSLAEGIEKVDIDIIGLLLLAQTYEANQLAKFCLHVISTNFVSMKKRKEWNLLTGDNLKYVTENKWPPDSYLKQLKKYEKKNKKIMKSNNEYQFNNETVDKKKCFIQ